ncbi:MAG: hypothetical protein ACYTBZ_03110 [Planctomycetota bacterium]|jgi:hypothetical protein
MRILKYMAVLSLGILFLSAGVVAAANKDGKRFEYDPADKTIKASSLEDPNFYDADIAAVDDGVWIVWLQYIPGQGDLVWIGGRNQKEWTVKHKVTTSPGKYANPTITVDRDRRIWISYEAENNKQWDILLTHMKADGKIATAKKITSSPGPDINHRTAADPAGGIWITWQSDRGGQFDVLASHITSAGKDKTLVVSENSPMGDWHPDITFSSDGDLYVAWDAYDGTSYNIYARKYKDRQWHDTVCVADSPAFEGWVSLAPDGQGNVWLSWEEGATNWGSPYRARVSNYPKAILRLSDTDGPLHRFRLLRLAVLRGDGGLNYPADELPMPSYIKAKQRTGTPAGVKALGVYYERPRLTVDRSDRVWVIYRHYYAPWLGITNLHHVEEGWGLYARFLYAKGWSGLYRMDVGQGDGMQRIEVTPCQNGIAAVWTTGRTDRRMFEKPRARGLVLGRISPAKPKSTRTAHIKPSTEGQAQKTSRISDNTRTRSDRAQVGGRLYRLFFGDLHRHTDLSLCRVMDDGTMDDAYRYAIDVAGLDFLGITDHARDIARGDVLSQLWWRSVKAVLRHELAPNFYPMYAFERSRSGEDHNVISLRSDILQPYTYAHARYWQELDDDSFMIPHQTSRGGFKVTGQDPLFITPKSWEVINNARRPLLEIYQGCRDRPIEKDAHFAFAKGHRLGFIASSDHHSTGASFAGVWAEKSDRVTIFRAMQARRTFGATDKIRLLVHAGDYWMGQEIGDTPLPPIHIQARGTADIETMEIILDGQVHETLRPAKQNVELKYELKNIATGKHYFYLRLKQRDGNLAWSSPIWFNTN